MLKPIEYYNTSAASNTNGRLVIVIRISATASVWLGV